MRTGAFKLDNMYVHMYSLHTHKSYFCPYLNALIGLCSNALEKIKLAVCNSIYIHMYIRQSRKYFKI